DPSEASFRLLHPVSRSPSLTLTQSHTHTASHSHRLNSYNLATARLAPHRLQRRPARPRLEELDVLETARAVEACVGGIRILKIARQPCPIRSIQHRRHQPLAKSLAARG